MNTAYFYLTDEGEELAQRLSAAHPGDLFGKENFKETLRNAFLQYDYLVCIMATGIVVRILAPMIEHKTSDTGVVVMDQKGRHAISLLSGHLGGANDLAREMAYFSGGQAVITTATDVAGELSFDTFAKKYGMSIENIEQLKHISGALLSKKPVRVVSRCAYPEVLADADEGKMQLISVRDFSALYSEGNAPEPVPTVVIDEGFCIPENTSRKDTAATSNAPFPVLYLRPRTICVGIGCKRNAGSFSIEEALITVLNEEHISPLSLKCISTIPLKANEQGILFTASQLNLPVTVISTEDIAALDFEELNISQSDFVSEQTGVPSVSTASAYLASGKGTILRDKAKFEGVTIALSRREDFPSL